MPEANQPTSFYELTGQAGHYRATSATAGPWDPNAQHGGPPAALLATVMEAAEPIESVRLVRITVELLRPVPVAEISVQARVVRPGRRVRLIEASMESAGQTVALARGWQIASQPQLLPPAPPRVPRPDLPDTQPARFFTDADEGYAASIEWRFVSGSFNEPGPAQVWARVRIPLIADQPLTGLQRLLIVGDSANGISSVLPFDEWIFLPTSLTMTVHRHARGEWVFMQAETTLSDDGIGSCFARMWDTDGEVGTLTQPLVIAPRSVSN